MGKVEGKKERGGCDEAKGGRERQRKWGHTLTSSPAFPYFFPSLTPSHTLLVPPQPRRFARAASQYRAFLYRHRHVFLGLLREGFSRKELMANFESFLVSPARVWRRRRKGSRSSSRKGREMYSSSRRRKRRRNAIVVVM